MVALHQHTTVTLCSSYGPGWSSVTTLYYPWRFMGSSLPHTIASSTGFLMLLNSFLGQSSLKYLCQQCFCWMTWSTSVRLLCMWHFWEVLERHCINGLYHCIYTSARKLAYVHIAHLCNNYVYLYNTSWPDSWFFCFSIHWWFDLESFIAIISSCGAYCCFMKQSYILNSVTLVVTANWMANFLFLDNFFICISHVNRHLWSCNA